jgi:hypothetical protein
MTEEIHEGRPPVSGADKVLVEAYHQEPVKQAERCNELAKEFLKLELAIPGIYAAALRFVVDAQASVSVVGVALAFGLWLLALLLTLAALFPVKWRVLDNVVRRGSESQGSGAVSIETYFRESTRRRRNLLLWSAPLFLAGVAAAAGSVFV